MKSALYSDAMTKRFSKAFCLIAKAFLLVNNKTPCKSCKATMNHHHDDKAIWWLNNGKKGKVWLINLPNEKIVITTNWIVFRGWLSLLHHNVVNRKQNVPLKLIKLCDQSINNCETFKTIFLWKNFLWSSKLSSAFESFLIETVLEKLVIDFVASCDWRQIETIEKISRSSGEFQHVSFTNHLKSTSNSKSKNFLHKLLQFHFAKSAIYLCFKGLTTNYPRTFLCSYM